MTPAEIFKVLYSTGSLKEIFLEKIKDSAAVGRDGVRAGRFIENLDGEIETIQRKVKSSSYQFTGYKQKLILKGARKEPREISIPTIRDRLVLRALCNLLTATFEDACLPPPHVYIKNIKEKLKEVDEGYSFLRMDIRDYYPSIDHGFLIKRVRSRIRKKEILSLIEAAIKTPTAKKNYIENQNTIGLPQGLSISNILSSLYLHKFDKTHQRSPDYFFFRFVDDILIIAPHKKCVALDKKIRSQLKKIGLNCHPLLEGSEKAVIKTVTTGVDYLGYTVSMSSVSVRQSSYKKMFLNIARVFTDYKYSKNLERFLWRLNLKITGCIFEKKRLGWMHFFSQTEDKAQLKELDIFVQKMLQKYNASDHGKRVKRFIKSFHEIRFNSEQTKYIPNFDNYTPALMVDLICLITNKERAIVELWDIEYLKEEFLRITAREVSRLEKDILEVLS